MKVEENMRSAGRIMWGLNSKTHNGEGQERSKVKEKIKKS